MEPLLVAHDKVEVPDVEIIEGVAVNWRISGKPAMNSLPAVSVT